MAESEEELKSLLTVKEESEKVGLKLNIQKTKIMTSGSITSWQIYGKTVETVADFIFLGSKITADGDCSHKIKTLTPWKKNYDQPRQHIKKQRHYFVNEGPSSQGYGSSSSHIWMWELDCEESWVPKNWCFWTVVLEKTLESPLACNEIQPVHPEGDQSWVFIGKTDVEAETPIIWPCDAKSWCFELWCWISLLRVSWTARRSNQSILEEISPEYLLEGQRPKLKLKHFGHLMWKTDSLEKTVMLGKTEGRRKRGQQKMRWLDALLTPWTWVRASPRSWWWTGKPVVLQSKGLQRIRHDWLTKINWSEC